MSLLAEIVRHVWVAQQRQFLAAPLQERRNVLGHQVLVLHRDDRQVLADQRHDLARPVAGGVDHDLGPDRLAFVGTDQPFARTATRQAGDAGEPVDAAAGLAGVTRIGLGQLRWVDIAIERVPEHAFEVVRLQERIELAGLRRTQQLIGETLRLGHGLDVAEFVHALTVMGEAERTRAVIADAAVQFG